MGPCPPKRSALRGAGRCSSIALTATTSANVFINGAAFLIPTLHTERGLDLAAAGSAVVDAELRTVLTLIAWGYVVDRIGERIVLALGSVLISAAAFAAASVDSLFAVGAFLLLGGMAAASSNSASGRLVVGWFRPTNGDWSWASAKPPRWELVWAPW